MPLKMIAMAIRFRKFKFTGSMNILELQNKLLQSLNAKRVSERAVTSCPPVFEWDSSLAEIAQQWADQCALVEYNSNSSTRIPSR